MAFRLPFLRLTLALVAANAAFPALSADELPGGNSAAFHQRMMDWSSKQAPELPVREGRARISSQMNFVLPHLSSGFGYRSDPLRRETRMHSGIDIPGEMGTPIHASAGGVVDFAGWAGGYGQMVELHHGNGLATRYGHLSQILVRPGEAVGRGQTIALMGSTGRSTGSHLHFEVRANGHATNPLAYLHAPAEAGFARLIVPELPFEPHISRFAQARAAASGQTETF